jgi:hypothetical protein
MPTVRDCLKAQRWRTSPVSRELTKGAVMKVPWRIDIAVRLSMSQSAMLYSRSTKMSIELEDGMPKDL